MGGGLMQLVAYGAQDVYLSGNPQITFFKVVYRRHTNFAVEPIQQTWNGAPDFGRTVTCNINRNGDLITNMYVAVKLEEVNSNSIPTAWGYVNRLGHAMIDSVKIEIGGSKIDEQYGDWLNIWYELTHKSGQERGYAKMIGDVPELSTISNQTKRAYQLYVPLQFWFNRNNGLALPLIALQYHDVRITLIFRKVLDCINWEGSTKNPPSVKLPAMQDSYLLIDYVYLDSEERKRFAQASHEYLIEQLQFTGSESLSNVQSKYRLNFNHPSKYLIWVTHLDRYLSRNEWIAYASNNDWTAAKDRFAKFIYLSSRKGLASALNSGLYTVSVTNAVEGSNEATAAGDLFEPEVANGVTSSLLLSLLGKIEVKCVCQSDPPAGALTAVEIGRASSTTYNDVISQLLSNLIITRNDLALEDISRTVSELIAAGLNPLLFSQPQATSSVINYHNYGNFIDGTDNPVYNAKLQLNGHDRFQARDGNYFNYVQPYQHFSNTPCDGVNVYSFALKAEDHQPTGTCNFSRIDNATILVDVGLYNNANKDYGTSFLSNNNASGSLLNIYTMNYNVLRVMSGMAGTAYSN